MPITIVQTDERVEIREDNQIVGYVDDKYMMYGIGFSGYAEQICKINHRSEIAGKFKDWKESQKEKDLF